MCSLIDSLANKGKTDLIQPKVFNQLRSGLKSVDTIFVIQCKVQKKILPMKVGFCY